MVAGHATKTFAQRWIIKEAYPIYACVASASSAFCVMIGYNLTSDPTITIAKDKRTYGYTPSNAEGEAYYSHIVRRTSHQNTIGVFPNEAMSRPNVS